MLCIQYFLFLSSLFLGNFGKSLMNDIVSGHGHWQHTIEIKFDKTKKRLKKIS